MAAVSLASAPQRVALQHRKIAARRAASGLRCRASALPDQYVGKQFSLLATSEEATGRLAAILAAEMKAGDAFCLKGDEGAGKTTFR